MSTSNYELVHLSSSSFTSASSSSSSSSVSSSSSASSSTSQSISQRYKTELCRQFNESGDCKYGDKCQFAHGLHELKDTNRHPKYKTDLCKTYHSKGFCPYGPRCHFIHDSSEKRDNYTHYAHVNKRSMNVIRAATPTITKTTFNLSTTSGRFQSTSNISLASSGSTSPFTPTTSPQTLFNYALNNDALLIQWLLQLKFPKQQQQQQQPHVHTSSTSLKNTFNFLN